jgi:hypothetical protein
MAQGHRLNRNLVGGGHDCAPVLQLPQSEAKPVTQARRQVRSDGLGFEP